MLQNNNYYFVAVLVDILKISKIYVCLLAVIVLMLIIIVDLFTGNHILISNTYNSYALQAQSWLDGRLDLGIDYPHLELAYYSGKVFVSFPPLPSVIMIPFVMRYGVNTPDHIIALAFCVITAIYVFKLCKSFYLSDKSAFFLSIFICLGSNFFFISIRGGWVWYFAQILSFMFTIMSFYYANIEPNPNLGDFQKSNFLAPFFLACAVGCRPFQIFYMPITAYLLYRRFNKKDKKEFSYFFKCLLIWAIPAMIVSIFILVLNWLRFDSPFEFGHNYLIEFQMATDGQFSTAYLAENIERLFRLPYFDQNNFLSFHRFDGTAFWIVSPAYFSFALLVVISFLEPIKKRLNSDMFLHIVIPVLIILHLLVICLHKTMGGWHFGNRYTIDALPAVLIGLANLWKDDDELYSIINMPLFLAGLCINIIGTYWLYTS